jgi:hypothetical protein
VVQLFFVVVLVQIQTPLLLPLGLFDWAIQFCEYVFIAQKAKAVLWNGWSVVALLVGTNVRLFDFGIRRSHS